MCEEKYLQHRDATCYLIRDATAVGEFDQVSIDIVDENLSRMRIADTIPLKVLVIGMIDQLTPTGVNINLKVLNHRFVLVVDAEVVVQSVAIARCDGIGQVDVELAIIDGVP